MTYIQVLICPKCKGQMFRDEEQGYSQCNVCDWYGDPVELSFSLLEPNEQILRRRDSLVDLERFRLAQIEREDEFLEGERRWYANLSVADRFWEDSRRKRVRKEEIAAAHLFDRVMMEMWESWAGSLTRQLFSDSPLLDWGLRPDALDVWLSEEGSMPEVEAAFA